MRVEVIFPVPLQAANVAAAEIHLSSEIETLQKTLWENVQILDASCTAPLMNGGLQAPIRGAFFESEQSGLECAEALRANSMIAFPVFYPIVETGRAMLRFAVSASHSVNQLKRLIALLNRQATPYPHPPENDNASKT